MKDDWRQTLLQKKLTRKEFLQFMGASVMVVLGLSNFLALVKQLKSNAEPTKVSSDASNGFGSRKFGA